MDDRFNEKWRERVDTLVKELDDTPLSAFMGSDILVLVRVLSASRYDKENIDAVKRIENRIAAYRRKRQ